MYFIYNSQAEAVGFQPLDIIGWSSQDEEDIQKLADKFPDMIYFTGEIIVDHLWEFNKPINPYLPEPHPSGEHQFLDAGYRCTRCGVYNRPDVKSTKIVLDLPCVGRWAQSSKMRYEANNQWIENGGSQDLIPIGEDVRTHTMMQGIKHESGRQCSYHHRLKIWTPDGLNACLLLHEDSHVKGDRQ